MNTALTNSSFTIQLKEELARAVHAELTAVSSDAAHDKGHQVMTHPFNYLTTSDWDSIADMAKTTVHAATIVRQRLRLCGLERLSEKTYGNLAGMIAAVREPDMPAPRLHALVMDLKQALPAKPAARHTVTTFPVLATNLPRGLFLRACGDGAPEPRDLAHSKSCLARCPVRTSHKSVRGSTARTEIVQPPADAQRMFESLTMGFAKRFLGQGCVMDIATGHDLQGQRPATSAPTLGDLGVTLLRTNSEQSLSVASAATPTREVPSSLVHVDAMIDAPPCAGDDVPIDDADDIVHQLEKLAAQPEALKRPASACAAMKKRPASAPIAKPPPAPKTGKSAKKNSLPAPKAMKKSTKLKLGCSRCRGGKLGCLACRNPAFLGKRFQKHP